MISLKNTLKAITSKFSALNTLLNDVPHYTLLWTNPNPTSSFAAQTISLDLSKYDAVEVVARQYATDSFVFSSKAEVGKFGKLFCYGYDDARELDTRRYEVSTTGVSFQTGYYTMISDSSGTASSTHCVPYKIYGIKFGGGYNLSRLFKSTLFSRIPVFKGVVPKGVFA